MRKQFYIREFICKCRYLMITVWYYLFSCHHQLLRCWIPRPTWRENTFPGPQRFLRLRSSLTPPLYEAMPKSRRNRTVRASTSPPQITGIKCAYIRPFSIGVRLSVVHFFCVAVLCGMFFNQQSLLFNFLACSAMALKVFYAIYFCVVLFDSYYLFVIVVPWC